MNFKLNLGAWNNIFAIPTDIVDKHLKTAGHKQLQILLYMLRNTSKTLSIELLAQEFNMHEIDVKDCLLFWECEGIISKTDDTYTPCKTSTSDQLFNEKTDTLENTETEIIKPTEISATVDTNNTSTKLQTTKKSRAVSRPQKPDMIYVSARIKNCKELQFLMQEAEDILGRTLSTSDFSTLVMLHDDDGLPTDVIIMLLQFCKSNGKTAIRYIERVGVNWASEEIDTLEKAENKIKEINQNKDSWRIVSNIFGITNTGSPTKLQTECATRWLKEWKYSAEMLRIAYEITIDTKGEYNLKYIDGVIKRWRKNAIQTVDDYKSLTENKSSASNKNKNEQQNSSYNLDLVNQSDLFDL